MSREALKDELEKRQLLLETLYKTREGNLNSLKALGNRPAFNKSCSLIVSLVEALDEDIENCIQTIVELKKELLDS